MSRSTTCVPSARASRVPLHFRTKGGSNSRPPRAAAAIGIPDAYRGESVKAFVVLKGGMTATEAEIVAFCKERLAAFKVPKAVEFTNELPKSLVGKVLRRELRERELTRPRPSG